MMTVALSTTKKKIHYNNRMNIKLNNNKKMWPNKKRPNKNLEKPMFGSDKYKLTSVLLNKITSVFIAKI